MSSPTIRPLETMTRVREETLTPAHGSRTLTVEQVEEEQISTDDEGEQVGVLRLTGDMNARRRVLRWDDSVIDNEHMNKKKTKICCIYHKPHAVGESSDSESSSSSSSDNSSSDSDSDRCRGHQHKKKKKRNPRNVSPNAYERQPVYNKKPSN